MKAFTYERAETATAAVAAVAGHPGGTFVAGGANLLAWLEEQPALTAVAALDRLQGLHPDRFTADHLRTMQRFMKVRRLTMAREVLLGPLPLSTALTSDGLGVEKDPQAKGDTKSLSNIPS